MGMGYRLDLKELYEWENGLVGFNGKGVLLGEKIKGKYGMVRGGSEKGDRGLGDIYMR